MALSQVECHSLAAAGTVEFWFYSPVNTQCLGRISSVLVQRSEISVGMCLCSGNTDLILIQEYLAHPS